MSQKFHDRPILMSAPMVRSLLDGSKTETRRLVRIDDTPISAAECRRIARSDLAPLDKRLYQKGIPTNAQNVRMCGHYLKCDAAPGSHTVSNRVLCPYGNNYEFEGDRLWVRETWRTDAQYDDRAPRDVPTGARILYEADWPVVDLREFGWGRIRQSIFMRRWMSRLLLPLERVTVQRLHAINDEDIRAEGVSRDVAAQLTGRPSSDFPTLRDAWAAGWDAINGHRATWTDDPFVWVLQFTVIKSVAK